MCLFGLDTTEYRPQQWQILAPGARKLCKIDLPTNQCGLGTLQDYLFSNDKRWGAWSKLARPAALAHSLDVRCFASLEGSPRPSSRIELMPTEIIALVLQDPGLETSDILALGLASQTLWLHVLRHVEKDLLLKTAPLAGMEITCTGSYLTDFPNSFAKYMIVPSTESPWQQRNMCQARIINLNAASTYEKLDQEDFEDMWVAALNVHDIVAAGIPNATMEIMAAELIRMCSVLRGHSPDAPWILRNLNKQEYIRCIPGSGSKENRGFVDHSKVKLSIDDALLLRICWTSRLRESRSWKDPKALGICHGNWAGDAFDIVLLEQEDVHGRTDVTDSIVKQARTVARKLPGNRGILALTKENRSARGTTCRMTRSMRKEKLEAAREKRKNAHAEGRQK